VSELKEKLARARKLERLNNELDVYSKGALMSEPFGTYNKGKAENLVKTIKLFKEGQLL